MSPIDRVVRGIHRRGFPSWALFLVLLVLIALLIMVGKWVDGTVPFPQLHLGALNGFYLAAGLAAYGLLTRAAGRALDRIEPVLDGNVDRERARRRLTTMPTWQFIASFLIGAAVAGALMLYVPAYTANVASPSLSTLVVGVVGFAVSYGVTVVAGWQCLRIGATVVSLHRRVQRVDLFRPAPAHAFAPVTAGVGIYLMSSMVFSVLSNPASLTDPFTVALLTAAVLTGIGAFVLPLAAMRSRLLDAKRELADDNAVHLAAAADDMHAAIDAKEYDSAGGIQSALDALTARRELIRRASTLPWEPRVANGFATTLLAPIAIWLVTTVVGRLVGL
jgi:hypothetical protein